ncbi:hypothetical protein M2371_001355 [Buttiauxella sp. BIGb0471]|nr:hypothetical protein [Buttiauxella sp. BIGb0471]
MPMKRALYFNAAAGKYSHSPNMVLFNRNKMMNKDAT